MKKANRLRKINLHVFLLPEEYEILRAKCDELDLTYSDYIRQIIYFGDIQTRYIKESRDAHKAFMYEINHIGGNINQIAHNTNIKKEVTPSDLEELQKDLIKIYHAYSATIKGKLDDINSLLIKIDKNLERIASKCKASRDDLIAIRHHYKEIKNITNNHFNFDYYPR